MGIVALSIIGSLIGFALAGNSKGWLRTKRS
jgi:hypothetical protein